MKKLYTIILSFSLTLVSFNANATIHNISVGAGGNNFSPTTFNVVVGDVMKFNLTSGVHNVTGGTIPGGAAPINSGTMTSGSYSYTITVAGNYEYFCSFHGTATTGMHGTFTATTVGIDEAYQNSSVTAFPNPCVDKLIFKYNGIQKIEVLNVVGEKVKSIELGSNEGTIEMSLEGMTSGIYFYRTYKDGIVCETKKIVKAK